MIYIPSRKCNFLLFFFSLPYFFYPLLREIRDSEIFKGRGQILNSGPEDDRECHRGTPRARLTVVGGEFTLILELAHPHALLTNNQEKE